MTTSPSFPRMKAGVRTQPTHTPPSPLRTLPTLLLTALLFLWPALLNNYPLVFSDTGGFLEQALMPDIGWDKPWIYGPLLTPFHLRQTLWGAAFMQALLLSATLWLTQCAALPTPTLRRHLILCTALAALSAAPWFASLLMPDILAPIAALGLFILAQDRLNRPTRLAVAATTTLAIAAHLAHLILAAACIAALALLDRQARLLLRTAGPLAAAIALLLLTNLVGNHRLAISPFGADFALARLVADGPARQTIDESCPAAGWRLCAWRGRLPTDSDAFLWDPNGPVWANGSGPTRIAPEAGTVVRATLLAHPGPVLAAAAANTLRQLLLTSLGDTLGPDYLEIAVLPRIETYFPPAEAARLEASRQYNNRLAPIAHPLIPLQSATLIAAALLTTALALTQWRRNRPLATLATLTLIALLANAFSTGALSGPHNRYEARLSWLLLIPPLLLPLPPAGKGQGEGLNNKPRPSNT